MFIVDQEGSAAYRAEKIISVRVCGKEHGFMDGWIYARMEGMPPKAGEVELGVYKNWAIAEGVMRRLLKAMSDGYLDVFCMPKDLPRIAGDEYEDYG